MFSGNPALPLFFPDSTLIHYSKLKRYTSIEFGIWKTICIYSLQGYNSSAQVVTQRTDAEPDVVNSWPHLTTRD